MERQKDEAISLASTRAFRADLHARAARGAAAAGDSDASWAHLVSGSADYQATNDAASEARMLSAHMNVYATPDRVRELTTRLIDVEARIPDEHPVERVLALSALANRSGLGLKVEEALDYSERALVLAHSLDDEESLWSASHARGIALHLAGRPDDRRNERQ